MEGIVAFLEKTNQGIQVNKLLKEKAAYILIHRHSE